MSSRRLIYPYTLTAKVLNFPFREIPFGLLAGFTFGTLFAYKLSKIFNTKENYAAREKYNEMLKKEHERHMEHLL